LIDLTKLMAGKQGRNDSIRFPENSTLKPRVMVFNVTRNCNLHCAHCYSGSGHSNFKDLPLGTWLDGLKSAADLGVKHLLISGGEPLVRRDVFTIMEEARQYGLTLTLSTNGTLLGAQSIQQMKRLVDYVGISIDGPQAIHDTFRGVNGAFRRTLENARRCREAGIRTGFRFTLTKHNADYVDFMLKLAETEKIDRICFYHLGYVGRASSQIDISNEQRLDAMLKIAAAASTSEYEILTADNSVDGILAYMLTGAESVYSLLRKNGGNKSGERIADVDPDGNVYPDQFTHLKLGNIRELGSIWNGMNRMVEELANRRDRVVCASCRYFDICNGNSRGRALASGGDIWGFDPSCYLSNLMSHFAGSQNIRAVLSS
jgi:radical SAM protein with 4Fe4S-binding SPASM domain